MRRWAAGLVGLVGIGLAALLLGVLALAVVTPVTGSGAGYLTAGVLVAGGLIGVWRWGTRALVVSLAGVLLAVGVAGARVAQAGYREGPLRVVVLPAGDGTRWVNLVVDEQDLLLFGEALKRLVGGVSRREHAGLAPALTEGYAALRAAQGGFASPVMSTYLFWQGPGAFDAVVVEAEGEVQPEAAVVFLHGFAGNVSLQCWEIAQAVRAQGVLTLCPSTGWIGDWWRPGGEATLRATLAYVRGRGVQRIYVGGFSNGGVGVGRLAAELAEEEDVRGLFFMAGTSQAWEVQATGLPVLIIQGAQDERMGAPAARQAAAVIGEAVRYVEVEADHFSIVKEAEAVREALERWVEEREGER
jgi:pimeloyl-ACP methyl ester carboxylesterase